MSQMQTRQIGGTQWKSLAVHLREWCAAACREILNRRAARKEIGRLGDRALRDIGLTQHDVESTLSAPLSQNAALGLRSRIRLRLGNW